MGIIQTMKLIHDYIRKDESGQTVSTKRALNEIELTIEPHSFVAILGPNGCGKSTFARHLNALLLPTAGVVCIDSLDTKDENNHREIRRRCGMVFQNPDNQIIGTIVEEDVAFGPENLGIPTEEIRKRVDRALTACNMQAYRLESPDALSGGQKQRVAIAGVLAMKPNCIVLDEPTAMLNPTGRREVVEALRELNEKEGITIILITHFPEEALLANRILVMQDGGIVMDGAPTEIFARGDELVRCGLKLPQIAELAASLRERGFPIREDIFTKEELLPCLMELAKPDLASADINLYNEQSQEDATPWKEETSVKYGFPLGDETSVKYGFPPGDETSVREELLRLEAVDFVYSNGYAQQKNAVSSVNLAIYAGEMIGLVGHTGAGKSTLVQHLNGLLRPTSGKVYYRGRNIWEKDFPIRQLRQKVGLVFQYPEHQLFEETVLRDVAFGPRNMGYSKEEAETMAMDAIRTVGLGEEYAECSPFELSGGEKRRVAIAGVLAMKPEVLILDEPTAGLDPKGRDMLMQLLFQLRQDEHITILLISHNMEDMAQYTDRILLLDRGRLAFDGTTRDFFTKVEHLEVFGLEVPEITELTEELIQRGIPLDKPALSVREAADMLEDVLRRAQ